MFGLFVQRHAEAAALTNRVAVVHVYKDSGASERTSLEISTHKNVLEIRLSYRPFFAGIPFLSSFFSLLHYFYACSLGMAKARRTLGRPDLVHVQVLTRMGAIAMFYKWWRGYPYLITEHWSRYQAVTGNYKGFLRKWVTALVVRHASALATVTENLLQAMNQQGLRNKTSVILPNVADSPFFETPIVENTGDSSTLKKVVHVSCFEDRSKNIRGILNVVKKLENKRSDFEMIMIGDGQDWQRMKDYAEQLRISPVRLQFTGLLSSAEIAQIYSSSDILVVFSNYENLPVVINEAYASGLKVVSSDVGGISEVVKEPYGVLVKAGDEQALLSALRTVLDEPANTNREALRDYALANFSLKAVAAKLDAMYNSVTDV
jgi:glycosyltransferase involved in cell wall biosynthesis